eukprot:TRINITY_DN26073_c0_g1_i1.p1 TRINITY_DN26073_c0_g1~~TRINITY_DN26073_c0_g1_i1.p1  ORF type:complete len:295 (+),score=39.29 TRINITY_DN26073_c0_g1_i1:302-1186(+)
MPLSSTKVWADSSSSVHTIVHRSPRPAGGEANVAGGPLATYQGYVGLKDWEEKVPVKRLELRDYIEEPQHSADVNQTSMGAVPRLVTPSLAGDSVPSARTADTFPRLVESRAPYSARFSNEVPVAHESRGGDVRGMAHMPPEADDATTSSPRWLPPAIPSETPRARIRRRLPPPGSTPEELGPVGNAVTEGASIPLGLQSPEAPRAELTIRTVRAVSRGQVKSDHTGFRESPRITSQDKAVYAPAQLRPARRTNITCRKRLDELLELPSSGIVATGKHASRAYTAIPGQNLRVE